MKNMKILIKKQNKQNMRRYNGLPVLIFFIYASLILNVSGTPNPVTNLRNTTYETSINWTWTNPPGSGGYDAVEVYLDNDLKNSNKINYYHATGLKSNTIYIISIRTKKINGKNILFSEWRNQSTRTGPDTTPPQSITNLRNISYSHNYINWTWTDPSDLDFSKVMVYINGTFKANVTRGNQSYNATGLDYDTQFEISTRTVDFSGNINRTWKNDTARTAKDILPPNTNIFLSGDLKASGWYASFVTINFQATDDLSGVDRTEYKQGNSDWISFSSMITLTSQGETPVKFRSIDKAGNVEAEHEIIVKIDTVQPIIYINNVADGLYNTTVTPEIIIFDVSNNDITVTLNNDPFAIGTTLSEDGDYILNVSTIDQTGNTAERSIIFTIDTEPPSTITNLNDNVILPDRIKWTWTDSQNEDFSYVMVYIDGIWKTDVIKGIQFYEALNLNEQTQYNISTRTVDIAGNINQTWVNRSTMTSPVTESITCEQECGFTVNYIVHSDTNFIVT